MKSYARSHVLGAIAAMALALTIVGGAGPAFAHPADGWHDGVGVLNVEARHPVGPSGVHYVVALTWSADSHVADTATVTATIVDPSGLSVPVVLPFEPVSGRYMGTVHFPSPGLWMVRFASSNPAASVDSLELVPPALIAPPTVASAMRRVG